MKHTNKTYIISDRNAIAKISTTSYSYIKYNKVKGFTSYKLTIRFTDNSVKYTIVDHSFNYIENVIKRVFSCPQTVLASHPSSRPCMLKVIKYLG